MTAITKMVRPLPKAEAKKIPSIFSLYKGQVVIRCKEHKRDELVQQKAFHTDLGYWYHIGLHPRFSILDAFRKAAQRADEVVFLIGIRSRRDEESAAVQSVFFKKALADSKTAKKFLEIMRPRLFKDLVNGDTTYRVTTAFKDRFEARAFTADDFFAEPSQEIRRLILRSGLPIKSITDRLTLAAEDEEGKLYRMKVAGQSRPAFPNPNEAQYLYVVCPSTKQEYLLGVPATFKTPKEARRWTFGLDADAQFMKEA